MMNDGSRGRSLEKGSQRMDWIQLAHYAGALINVALGLAALLFPRRVADRLGLYLKGKLGLGEVRATYGGLFLGLGVFSLIQGNPLLFRMLGFGWLLVGLGRMLSMVIDRSMTRDNVVAFTVEMLVAWLLLVNSWG